MLMTWLPTTHLVRTCATGPGTTSRWCTTAPSRQCSWTGTQRSGGTCRTLQPRPTRSSTSAGRVYRGTLTRLRARSTISASIAARSRLTRFPASSAEPPPNSRARRARTPFRAASAAPRARAGPRSSRPPPPASPTPPLAPPTPCGRSLATRRRASAPMQTSSSPPSRGSRTGGALPTRPSSSRIGRAWSPPSSPFFPPAPLRGRCPCGRAARRKIARFFTWAYSRGDQMSTTPCSKRSSDTTVVGAVECPIFA
jgi:hypothetical protein